MQYYTFHCTNHIFIMNFHSNDYKCNSFSVVFFLFLLSFCSRVVFFGLHLFHVVSILFTEFLPTWNEYLQIISNIIFNCILWGGLEVWKLLTKQAMTILPPAKLQDSSVQKVHEALKYYSSHLIMICQAPTFTRKPMHHSLKEKTYFFWSKRKR